MRGHVDQGHPPAFLQLAGHPLRWRLLAELAESDRTVRELADRSGEAHNLVSYHLGKLRRAGVVSGRRSSADGRDSYYTADLARIRQLLSATAAALHPGLAGDPPPTSSDRQHPVRVLFLCTGNSARSLMAEALVRRFSGGAVQAFSAGSHPKPVHPQAIRVMRSEHGIDVAGHVPQHLSSFAGQRFDWVVTLCDRVREVCPEFPGHPHTIHWSIPDPAAGNSDGSPTYQAFLQTSVELETRIRFLLSVLAQDNF